MPESEKRPFLPYDHELSLSELFSETFRVARANYRIVLPIFITFGIINALVNAGITLATPPIKTPSNLTSSSTSQLLAMESSLLSSAGFIVLGLVLTLFVLYFSAGIGVWKIDRALKTNVSGGCPLKGKNLLNLALTTTIVLTVILLSSILFIIPALFVATIFYLCLAASVLEDKGAFEALARSRSLVSKRWGKTFALLAGTGLIAFFSSFFVATITSIALSGSTGSVVSSAVQGFVEALAFPLVSSSMIVLYYSYSLKDIPHESHRSPYDYMRPEPLGSYFFAENTPPRYCPQCGVRIFPEERYCHNCGHPQEEVKS